MHSCIYVENKVWKYFLNNALVEKQRKNDVIISRSCRNVYQMISIPEDKFNQGNEDFIKGEAPRLMK